MFSLPCILFDIVLVLMPLSSGLAEGVEGAAIGFRAKKSVMELSLNLLLELEEVRLLYM